MGQLFKDALRTELDGELAAGSNIITVIDGSAFPVANAAVDGDAIADRENTDWFKLVLQDDLGNFEVVYCHTHAAMTHTFSVIRGQDGTTALDFPHGTVVGLRLLSSDISALYGAIDYLDQYKQDASSPAAKADAFTAVRPVIVSGAVQASTTWDGSGSLEIETNNIDVSKANAGTLLVTRGGTGVTAHTSGQVLVGNGSNAVTSRAIDTTTGGTSSSNSLITSGAVNAGLALKVDKAAGQRLMSDAEGTKLSGIATGATANATDADLRDRTTHTGTQAISTVTGLQDALDTKQTSLVSGINIKTISGESLLGGGNLEVPGSPTLQGDTAPYTTQTKKYQITNFNSFSSYEVSASAGTVVISGDTLTYTAPNTEGAVDLTLTVDGRPTVFSVSVQPPAPPYIPTPTPTPENFGDPLEGGFYAGMIWNQIAQSETSMVMGMGTKVLSVPSMVAAAIVYQGQMVEVRSRTNPDNKFAGTVVEVRGTNLTINVTSVDGNGTFADWSIMARHRVIVAPKASGERANINLKNAETELPTACQTLTEGFAATQAMYDADSSTVYPAAHWARNLNIGGRTDWYIPARDELELCWRNLKPVTNDNYATANRPTTADFSYTNNGSYGALTNTHGLNNNSYPAGAAYTADVPAQTAATAFRAGGAEAYELGTARYYWSSSDYGGNRAWRQHWDSSTAGIQGVWIRSGGLRVRAVRRSVI